MTVTGLPPGAVQPPPTSSLADGGGIAGVDAGSDPSDEIYYLGIIDMLQVYDLRKRGETVLKSWIHPVSGLSAVSPAAYATRFIGFIAANTT